jgi:hypothetical protein
LSCISFRDYVIYDRLCHVFHLETALYDELCHVFHMIFMSCISYDWSKHGITLMCDSWMGPTGMSIINFMVYCNGVMFFYKSADCTGHNYYANYVFGVTIFFLLCNSLLLNLCLMYVCGFCRRSRKWSLISVKNILCKSCLTMNQIIRRHASWWVGNIRLCGNHALLIPSIWYLSHPVLRPNRMLIVCVHMNQVYTHIIQNMDTEIPMSQYILFITK